MTPADINRATTLLKRRKEVMGYVERIRHAIQIEIKVYRGMCVPMGAGGMIWDEAGEAGISPKLRLALEEVVRIELTELDAKLTSMGVDLSSA